MARGGAAISQKLLQIADDSGKVTLSQFSLYLTELTAREARESEAAPQADNALRLMTAHASKGLEFPMVIIAEAARRPRASSALLHVNADLGSAARSMTPPATNTKTALPTDAAIELQKLKGAAEEKRLLYVAATRAQDYLLVSGAFWQDRSGAWTSSGWLRHLLEALDLAEISPRATQILDFAGHPLRVDMPAAPPTPDRLGQAARLVADRWDFEPAIQRASAACAAAAGTPARLRRRAKSYLGYAAGELGGFLYADKAQNRQEAARRFREAAQETPPASMEGAGWQAMIGAIVHEILRDQAFNPSDTLPVDMIDALAWERGLSDASALSSLRSEARTLLENYQNSVVRGWIAQARQDNRPVYTELNFIFPWRGRVIHGAMDVLLQAPDGKWRIIDYKSGGRGDLSRHAQRYRLQLGVYAAAVQEKLNLVAPPRSFVHYLRRNRLIELPAADCRAELQRLESTLGEVRGA